MKYSIKLGLILISMCLSMNVYAQSSYVAPLNSGLGNGAAVSCGACHSGSPSGSNAVLPMATTWRTGANIALTDTDGDGFNNAQEVSGTSTIFNIKSSSPFTIAKAAESSTSAKVVVTGAGIVTETAITDVYAQTGINLATGHIIAGAVSPLVTSFPATIFFNKAVNSGDKVYAVDLAAKTSTLVSGATFNAKGSVTVSGLTGSVNIVVDRATPVVPGSRGARGGEEEEEGLECVTGQISTPLTMVLIMMSLGFLVRRKKE